MNSASSKFALLITAPDFGSRAANIKFSIREWISNPQHMAHGSRVTYRAFLIDNFLELEQLLVWYLLQHDN